MAEHTPGPWTVSSLDGRTCGPSRLVVLDGAAIPQQQAVAIVTLRTNETEANARLIAAAPALLAALKALAFGRDTYPDGPFCFCQLAIGNPMVTTHASTCVRARAVIAQVEEGASV